MRTRLWQCVAATLVVGLLGLPGAVLPAAGDEGSAVAGATAPSASPGSGSTDNTEVPKPEAKGEEGAETPEIEVEVVGRKTGEQALPSYAPTTGEVVTSINSAELAATGETNLADALEFLPGVTVTHQGRRYETFVNVRGASSPVVLLDGALISSGIFANRILYAVPLAAIARVDVIRSSSSLIYGPQALTGGAINIVTKSGKGKERGEYTASLEGGSFDYRRAGISVGQGEADKGFFLAGDYDTSNSNLEFGEHRLQREFFKFDEDLRHGDTVKFSLLNIDGQRNFDVWDNAWQAFAKTGPVYWGIDPYREKLATLAYSRPFHRQSNSGLDVELWWRNQFYHNFSFGGPIQPKVGQIPFYDEVGDIYGANAMVRLQAARDHYIRLGMETWKFDGYTQNYVLQSDGTLLPQPQVPYWTSAAGSQAAQSKDLDYFAQDEWSVTPRTRFFYGGRYEIPGYGLRNTSTYALGLEQDLRRQVDLYAHFGTGVLYPTPAALASNPRLQNETSDNVDVGIEKHFRNLVGRVGWFRSAISNYFVSYLKTGGSPSKSTDYIQTQADYTQSGLEAECEGTVPSVRSLSYFANYTRLEVQVMRPPVVEGQPLQLAIPPKGQFSLGLRWSPDRRTHLALSYTNVGDQLARSGYYSMAYPLPGYQYANLTASRDLGSGWKLNAALLNMFDESYETQPGFPRPGRNWTLGFSRTASMK